MSTASIDQFDELPRIKGPKLRRFKDGHYKRIEYLELLSRSNDEGQLPNGGHGYVFRVRIDGELYALENCTSRDIYYLLETDNGQFRFFDLGEALVTLDPAGRSRRMDASRRDHENDLLQSRATALLAYPQSKNPSFAKKFNITEWNRPEEELSSPPTKRQPLRALVKDLVETDPEITEKLNSVNTARAQGFE
ncbi:hypothetical protein H2202_010684 [Exophiala xenobiotica]|nr:hypothetical protein H2202_010684 [Exophiala xenobiotica]